MEKKSKRIYLSLPISGYDLAERRATASGKEREMEKSGWSVFNPMENGLPFTATTQQHMREDIRNLLNSDAIYMMRGWNRSAGCLTELHVATAIGLEVYFENKDGEVFI